MTSGSYYDETLRVAQQSAANNMGAEAGLQAAEQDYQQGCVGARRVAGYTGQHAEFANRAFLGAYDSRIAFRVEQAKPRPPFTWGGFFASALTYAIAFVFVFGAFYAVFSPLFR